MLVVDDDAVDGVVGEVEGARSFACLTILGVRCWLQSSSCIGLLSSQASQPTKTRTQSAPNVAVIRVMIRW